MPAIEQARGATIVTKFLIPARAWIAAVICLAALTVNASNVAASTPPQAAAQFMEQLSQQALGLLRDQSLSLSDRETKVRRLLEANFDLDLIGRYVLGPAWRKASPEQRETYLRLFREWVVRTYARRLGGYTGQTFEIVGAKALGNTDAIVDTKISRPSGPPILAGWRVRNTDGHFKILDVMVQGVSMVVTQRSEFRNVVSRKGLDGLIEILRLQVSKFAASGN
jgi:phospholipid transport system substrate-binding protein